jgi:hypothetical protein
MMRRKVFLTDYRVWFALTLSAFPACASQTVRFVHPETGATAECGASGFGIGASFSPTFSTRIEIRFFWGSEGEKVW